MIGYDANKYNEMMHNRIGGNFDMICENIMQMQDYVEKSGSDCVVATYHLITDNDNQEEELDRFIENVIRVTDKQGTVLIPAFANGRTQDMLIRLYQKCPELDVHVDGMGKRITKLYFEYENNYKDRHIKVLIK